MNLLAIIFIIPTLMFGMTETSSQLYFSENPIQFKPPIVIKNNISYIPIRELTDYFDAPITFSKRHYHYQFNINNSTLTIKPNSSHYMIINNKNDINIFFPAEQPNNSHGDIFPCWICCTALFVLTKRK